MTSKINKPVQFAVKPMSDDDVNQERISLSKLNADDLNNIVNGFANCISGLLVEAERRLKSMQDADEDDVILIDSLNRLLRLAPNDEKFIRCKDKILVAQDMILNQDDTFFMKVDLSKNIKNDENKDLMNNLIKTIRNQWQEMNQKEKTFYWKKLAMMLKCVLTFQELVQKNQ